MAQCEDNEHSPIPHSLSAAWATQHTPRIDNHDTTRHGDTVLEESRGIPHLLFSARSQGMIRGQTKTLLIPDPPLNRMQIPNRWANKAEAAAAAPLRPSPASARHLRSVYQRNRKQIADNEAALFARLVSSEWKTKLEDIFRLDSRTFTPVPSRSLSYLRTAGRWSSCRTSRRPRSSACPCSGPPATSCPPGSSSSARTDCGRTAGPSSTGSPWQRRRRPTRRTWAALRAS